MTPSSCHSPSANFLSNLKVVKTGVSSVLNSSGSSKLQIKHPVFAEGLSSEFYHQVELSINAVSRPTSSSICLAPVAMAVEERNAKLGAKKKA